ncbi:MAG: LysM peptidoglycan-binding domain-containing protein [Planctomycetes bacterium]|jgi:LysM repeat protein|nr:LysM peptidoglycan-binding domain-containing protein [Planctomycetota bacterium]MCL4731534.1 LysM peptidoglycan-binding domain-containing protein [Planctomycetota bacterium]
MTRSRISMVVAAGALVLVGLLAFALFSPSEQQPTETPAPAPEVAKVEPPKATPSVLGNPVTPPPAPAPAPAPTPKETPKEPVKEAPKIIDYTIKAGDMIAKIAARHGVKKEDIYALNPGLDDSTASKIRVGQVIKVPTGPGAVAETPAATPAKKPDYYPRRVITAQPGDTAFQLAVEHYGSISMFERIIQANPGLPWKDRLAGGEQVVLPEWGTPPAGSKVEEPKKPAAPAVARDSLIPPRR